MHEPDLHPDTPDPAALRRRVLLTAFLALASWIVAVVVLDAFSAPPVHGLSAAVLIYVVVVRPLMQPVRDAVKLRRRLAYQSWLDQREQQDDRG